MLSHFDAHLLLEDMMPNKWLVCRDNCYDSAVCEAILFGGKYGDGDNVFKEFADTDAEITMAAGMTEDPSSVTLVFAGVCPKIEVAEQFTRLGMDIRVVGHDPKSLNDARHLSNLGIGTVCWDTSESTSSLMWAALRYYLPVPFVVRLVRAKELSSFLEDLPLNTKRLSESFASKFDPSPSLMLEFLEDDSFYEQL